MYLLLRFSPDWSCPRFSQLQEKDRSESVEYRFLGLTIWTTVVALQVNHLRKLEPELRQKFVIRVILGQTATLPLVIAGIAMLVAGGAGLYWLVPAVIFAFLVAFLDAWVLLVEINR